MSSTVQPVLGVDVIHAQANPRTVFDKDAMAELEASIREHGVIEPVVVRPSGDGTSYDLIAGERRLRAARAAGLTLVPVRILEADDAKAAELRLVENVQREDLDWLDEAQAYKALREKHKLSVDDIAARTGKSRRVIFQRLQMVSLPSQAVKAMRAGKLRPGVAALIARIPDEKARLRALKECLDGQGTEWFEGDDVNGAKGRETEPMTVANAERLIRTSFMLRLTSAAFPVKDATLVPDAGGCDACPHRTGNATDLFGGVVSSPDVCTNPPCFATKQDAWWERRKAEVLAAGGAVLEGKQLKKALPHGRLYGEAPQGFVNLEATCHQAPPRGKRKQRPRWRQEMGKHVPPVTLMRDPDTRKIYELVTARAAIEACKAAGAKWASAETADGRRKGKGESTEDRRNRLAGVRRRLSIAMACEQLRSKAPAKLTQAQWQALAHGALQSAWSDTVKDTARARDVAGKDPVADLDGQIASMSAADCVGLIAELLGRRDAQFSHNGEGGYGEAFTRIARAFEVDLRSVSAKARAQVDAEEKARAERKAKRGKGKGKGAKPKATKKKVAAGKSKAARVQAGRKPAAKGGAASKP